MKNITMSIEEATLVAVRRYAAARGTSVNRLVREYLDRVARREDQAQTVRQRLRQLSEELPARMAGETPSRDQLHERC